MATGTPAGDGRDVVFVLGRGYRTPLLRRGAAALLLAGLAALAGGAGFAPLAAGAAAAAFGAAAAAQAALYLWQGRFRARLSARGIEARGYFDHFIPWSDVTGIEVGGASPDAGPAPITGTPWDSPAVQPLSRVVYASEGGYRARLAAVRVSRRRDRSLLLRAPLVTLWQGDPEFQDTVRLIGQWWRGYGQGPAAQPR
jgi:hypothetical protein